MTPAKFGEFIRILNCTNMHEFVEVYGRATGKHLWNKFRDVQNHDIGKFIMDLDLVNLGVLIEFLQERYTDMMVN